MYSEWWVVYTVDFLKPVMHFFAFKNWIFWEAHWPCLRVLVNKVYFQQFNIKDNYIVLGHISLYICVVDCVIANCVIFYKFLVKWYIHSAVANIIIFFIDVRTFSLFTLVWNNYERKINVMIYNQYFLVFTLLQLAIIIWIIQTDKILLNFS